MFGRVRFNAQGALGTAFGTLELRVLEVLWRCDEATVADVQQAFERELAYTTLMTTLDRLYKKGILDRRKAGRAFVYRCRRSRADLERSVAARAFDALLGRTTREAEPVLSSLVEAVGERDRDLLDELERLVREKRKLLEQGEGK